jgi:hypothetical protein
VIDTGCDIEPNARELGVLPITPIPGERHDDGRLASVEIAERSGDR